MNSRLYREGRWRKLALLLLGSLLPLAAPAQRVPRRLFPAMPAHLQFSPTIIEGELPAESGLAVTQARIDLEPEPFVRNHKSYTRLNLRYDQELMSQLTLRQQGDTVWLAVDPFSSAWDSTQMARRLPEVQASIRALQQDPHNQESGRFSEVPTSNEESVFLRFDALVGARWLCYSRLTQGLAFYWVRLERIILQGRKEPLYQFSVVYSGGASHMPALLGLTVSRTRGIRGMEWYDYAFWHTPTYGCADLRVRYGEWE